MTTTTTDLVNYYSNLLPRQYVTQPNAVATIETSVTPFIMPQTSVQTIAFSPPPTSASFVIVYGDDANQITINWNDSATVVQEKLGNVAPGNLNGGTATSTFAGTINGGTASTTVFADTYNGGNAFGFDLSTIEVSGSIAGGLLTVTFVGVPEPAPLLALVSTSLMASGNLVTPVITETDLTLPLAIQAGFQITGPTPAVGAQLDIIGKYVGVKRTVAGFSTAFTLVDSDFLALIKMAIIRNNTTSDLYTIQTLLWQFFPGGQILVIDFADMSMSFLISETIGSFNLVQAFVQEGLLPAPMGVAYSVIYAPIITTFFGCVTYQQPTAINNSPCNTYQSYQTNRPCMDYSYGVVIP